MTDYSNLRREIDAAMGLRLANVSVDTLKIAALLADYDALRATFKPAKRNDYPPEFEEVWAEYPAERQGTKRTAYKAWAARIKSGIEPNEILLGLRRYLAHAKAIGTETNYLRLAATFFGPDEHFAANFVMPQQKQLGKAGSATASAAQEWLRGQGNG